MVIGRQLAEFVAEFSRVVSPAEINKLRKSSGVKDARATWKQYFQQVFFDQPLPDKRLKPIVEEYYAKWRELTAKELATFSIHDDLHPANVLFAGGKVTAILDFSDATVGSIEEEMRGVYRMGDVVARTAISHYQHLTDHVLDYENVKVWAIMNDLVRFTRYLGDGQTDQPMFLLARQNLRRWTKDFPL